MAKEGKLKYGKFKTQEGTIGYYLERDGKKQFHSTDGPAFIPNGEWNKREYHLFGIPISEKDFQYWKKNWEGVPDYKRFEGAGGRD
jgi:hypothetical protein